MIDFYFEEPELTTICNNMNSNGTTFKTIFEYIVNFKNDKYNLYFIEKIITQGLFFNNGRNTNHVDFLVNNYDLIKADNELDILFDAYMFKYFEYGGLYNNSYFYMYNYIGFNYVYKIYINNINNLIEKTLDKEQLNESLLNFKIKFNYNSNITTPNGRIYSNIEKTHMYKILSILNKKIDEKNDIFRNFDKKYASYYPIEIITLYNFYMHD
jgi:hypothetical protein